MTTPALPPHIDSEVERLSELGNQLTDQGRLREAVAAYDQAFFMLPEPRQQYWAATWLLTAIGDTHVQLGDFASGHQALTFAMHCPDALGNPFIHLRLGQCQLELGNLDRAADELMRAYMGAGPEIFADEDPRYFQFLATRAQGLQSPW